MEQKIKSLIELNKKHSSLFCAQRLERDLYQAKHPTNVMAFKCMDGRIHLPNITNTPLGIIKPYRNMGGKFNLGWPLLSRAFDEAVANAIAKGNRTLVLVTYHFSNSSLKRGCAGFGYDCDESIRFMGEFKKQIQRVYGKESQIVVPIVIGVETDTDAIILHGENGSVLNLMEVGDASDENLSLIIRKLFPNMPERIVNDLLPIVQGNIAHIAETKEKKPVTDLEHGEWVLAVGKGFDWLHTPNLALIVGPYDPNIGEPIKTAAGIIKSNFEHGRVDGGFVVLASAACDDAGDRLRARERALYMQKLTTDIINKDYPELASSMHSLSVVVDYNTMEMEIVK